MIEIGKKAPQFTLPTNKGDKVSLKDLRGNWVVIYFYPKDLTPGCTKQAIAFTEDAKKFMKRDATIIGVSPDSVEQHIKFTDKHDLKIILASDEKRKAIESYDVWKEKKMYGKTYMGVERSTFLVDRSGTVQAIWRKVKVPGHSNTVLEAIDQIERKNK